MTRHRDAIGATLSLRSARELSCSAGHLQGAPSEFVNAEPKAAELAIDASTDWEPLVRSDEATEGCTLVTSLHSPHGREVRNVFGNRTQYSALVLEKLLHPAFLGHRSQFVFNNSQIPYQSCQIGLRIDYSRGNPTRVVYVTHRITR